MLTVVAAAPASRGGYSEADAWLDAGSPPCWDAVCAYAGGPAAAAQHVTAFLGPLAAACEAPRAASRCSPMLAAAVRSAAGAPPGAAAYAAAVAVLAAGACGDGTAAALLSVLGACRARPRTLCAYLSAAAEVAWGAAAVPPLLRATLERILASRGGGPTRRGPAETTPRRLDDEGGAAGEPMGGAADITRALVDASDPSAVLPRALVLCHASDDGAMRAFAPVCAALSLRPDWGLLDAACVRDALGGEAPSSKKRKRHGGAAAAAAAAFLDGLPPLALLRAALATAATEPAALNDAARDAVVRALAAAAPSSAQEAALMSAAIVGCASLLVARGGDGDDDASGSALGRVLQLYECVARRVAESKRRSGLGPTVACLLASGRLSAAAFERPAVAVLYARAAGAALHGLGAGWRAALPATACGAVGEFLRRAVAGFDGGLGSPAGRIVAELWRCLSPAELSTVATALVVRARGGGSSGGGGGGGGDDDDDDGAGALLESVLSVPGVSLGAAAARRLVECALPSVAAEARDGGGGSRLAPPTRLHRALMRLVRGRAGAVPELLADGGTRRALVAGCLSALNACTSVVLRAALGVAGGAERTAFVDAVRAVVGGLPGVENMKDAEDATAPALEAFFAGSAVPAGAAPGARVMLLCGPLLAATAPRAGDAPAAADGAAAWLRGVPARAAESFGLLLLAACLCAPAGDGGAGDAGSGCNGDSAPALVHAGLHEFAAAHCVRFGELWRGALRKRLKRTARLGRVPAPREVAQWATFLPACDGQADLLVAAATLVVRCLRGAMGGGGGGAAGGDGGGSVGAVDAGALRVLASVSASLAGMGAAGAGAAPEATAGSGAEASGEGDVFNEFVCSVAAGAHVVHADAVAAVNCVVYAPALCALVSGADLWCAGAPHACAGCAASARGTRAVPPAGTRSRATTRSGARCATRPRAVRGRSSRPSYTHSSRSAPHRTRPRRRGCCSARALARPPPPLVPAAAPSHACTRAGTPHHCRRRTARCSRRSRRWAPQARARFRASPRARAGVRVG